MGKHQQKMIDFLTKYKGWHTYATDSFTRKIVKRLEELDFVETNEYNMFRLKG